MAWRQANSIWEAPEWQHGRLAPRPAALRHGTALPRHKGML